MEHIYGVNIPIPECPPLHTIDNYGLPIEEQRWVRKELPDYFSFVEYTTTGDLVLTQKQEDYARQEVLRCKNGYWLFIKGEPIFITGKNYFYLQWYKLESDIYPEYRAADRRYFRFLDYWERKKYCLGIIRTKKRREGASSQACSNLIYETIFYKNSNCGLVSKSEIDSKTTFLNMVTFAYRQLPVFLKPKQVNKETSVTELVFSHTSERGKDGKVATISKDEGHRSKIDYRSPTLNAYDSGRMSRILLDEAAKYPKETPASQLFSIISKTLLIGVKRVGFCELPSTVNEMTKRGGAEFKIIWDEANPSKQLPTVNRLVRYFSPAYEGFEGFIDQWGNSVVDAPTQEQYEYLVSKWVERDERGELVSVLSEDDIKMGAKRYITEKLRQGKDGASLEEEIRMNPCNEEEAFQSSLDGCHFNSVNIQKQRVKLADNPPLLRRGEFYRKIDQSVDWRDVDSGYWLINAFPDVQKRNKFVFSDRMIRPVHCADFVIGVDGYSASQGTQNGRKYGSKASGFVMDRGNMTFVAMYYGRPETKELYHEQMLLAAEFYSCKVWFEKTADSYYEYFKDRGKLGYLGKYPMSCIPPDKRMNPEILYGFPISPFAMTRQMDLLIAYAATDLVSGTSHCETIPFDKLLEQMLVFEADNRTEYDAVVAAMITLCCALEPSVDKQKITQPLIKIFS